MEWDPEIGTIAFKNAVVDTSTLSSQSLHVRGVLLRKQDTIDMYA